MTLIYWAYDKKLYLFYKYSRKGTLYLKHKAYYSSYSNSTTMSGGIGSGGLKSVDVSVGGGNSNYTQEGISYQNGIMKLTIM